VVFSDLSFCLLRAQGVDNNFAQTEAPQSFRVESASTGAFRGLLNLMRLFELPELLDYGLEEWRRQETGKLTVRGGVGDGQGAGVGVDGGLVEGRLFEG
jgi:hypothetical protein